MEKNEINSKLYSLQYENIQIIYISIINKWYKLYDLFNSLSELSINTENVG